MSIYLVKPDLMHFEQYNDMMREWVLSGTRIAPWFLDEPFGKIEDFAAFIRMLDNCEHGKLDDKYCSTTSYFVFDDDDTLVGAASLRHYLTIDGFNTFGHIGFGIRPSLRNKGYATLVLRLLLEQAKTRNIHKVLLGALDSNAAACRVIEKCGGILENTVANPANNNEMINRYWIIIK